MALILVLHHWNGPRNQSGQVVHLSGPAPSCVSDAATGGEAGCFMLSYPPLEYLFLHLPALFSFFKLSRYSKTLSYSHFTLSLFSLIDLLSLPHSFLSPTTNITHLECQLPSLTHAPRQFQTLNILPLQQLLHQYNTYTASLSSCAPHWQQLLLFFLLSSSSLVRHLPLAIQQRKVFLPSKSLLASSFTNLSQTVHLSLH